jgi:replicative DNA helicase
MKKCLGINTHIIMFTGSIKMVQDIKINDLIMGDDSTNRILSSI